MKKRVEYVSTLRGMAAMCVVIAHYFGVFWLNQPAVSSLTHRPALPDQGAPFYVHWLQFHPYFNWGSFGVAIFFLISGFVIANSLNTAPAGKFLKNRVIRIMPVYVAGFIVCLSAIMFNVTQSGLGMPFPASHVLIHFFPGLRDVFGTTGIDGIVWTLEIEAKFYLVCALAAPLFRRRSMLVAGIPVAIAAIIAAISYLWAPGFNVVAGRMLFAGQYLIYMFAGVFFYYSHVGRISRPVALGVSSALVMLFVGVWNFNPMGVPTYLAWNYVLAFGLFVFASLFQGLFAKNKVTNFFAEISYPLYVVHGVAGYTLMSVLRESGFRASATLAITTATAIGLAYLIHILIEKPFSKGAPRTATTAAA
jgi:peptidoglycan/LPS O-acetylase OafA/YrhL